MPAPGRLTMLAQLYPEIATKTVLDALERHGGNVTSAAEELAIDRTSLLRLVDRLELRAELNTRWPGVRVAFTEHHPGPQAKRATVAKAAKAAQRKAQRQRGSRGGKE